jgi:hypothetical protein
MALKCIVINMKDDFKHNLSIILTAAVLFCSMLPLSVFAHAADTQCAAILQIPAAEQNVFAKGPFGFLDGAFEGDRFMATQTMEYWMHPELIRELLANSEFKKKPASERRTEMVSALQTLFLKGRNISSHPETIDGRLWVILDPRTPSQAVKDEAAHVKTNYLKRRVEALAKDEPPFRIGVHVDNAFDNFVAHVDETNRLIAIAFDDAIRWWPSEIQNHELEHYLTFKDRMQDLVRARRIQSNPIFKTEPRKKKDMQLQIVDPSAHLGAFFEGLDSSRIKSTQKSYFSKYGYRTDEIRAAVVGFKTSIDDLDRFIIKLIEDNKRNKGPKSKEEKRQVRDLLLPICNSTFIAGKLIRGFINHSRNTLREAVTDLGSGTQIQVEANWESNRSITTSSGRKIYFHDYQVVSLMNESTPDPSMSPLKLQQVIQMQIEDTNEIEKKWLAEEKRAARLKEILFKLLT